MDVVVGRIGVAIVMVWMLGVGAMGNVVLYGKDVSLSFDDMEASFTPAIKATGECGRLYLADPPDACSDLANEVNADPNSPFALIIRGGCNFDEKVRNAQKAGFQATIIYNNEDSRSLIAMSGISSGIKIPAIFVSKASGEVLKKYAGLPDIDLWILPVIDDSPWSLMAISFVTLIAMSSVLATCCFVRSHHIRRQQPRVSQVREFHGGMSGRLVTALPTLAFTEVLDDCCTSTTCAFCLDDYKIGDKLRVLPCKHKFHVECVDSWLTAWRTFCPICKQDVRTSIGRPPPSERTPLLSPLHVSLAPAAASPSFHSSVASSPAIEIAPSSRSPLISRTIAPSPSQSPILSWNHSISSTPHTLNQLRSHNNSPASRSLLISRMITPSPSQSPIMSRNHSISSTPHTLNQLRSYNNSPAVSINRSSANVWNLSSQRSHASYLGSSHSLGHGLPSSINSGFASPYAHCSGNGSASYLAGSSSRLSYLRHNESVTSLSAFASSHSLAEN